VCVCKCARARVCVYIYVYIYSLILGILDDAFFLSPQAPPLVLRHLKKRYGGQMGGGKLAVKDLCLRVERGECFGFLGVNGTYVCVCVCVRVCLYAYIYK